MKTWDKLDRFRYWRKHKDFDLIVTLDEHAEWGWDAFRMHQRVTGARNGFETHRQAMRSADQWSETHLGG